MPKKVDLIKIMQIYKFQVFESNNFSSIYEEFLFENCINLH